MKATCVRLKVDGSVSDSVHEKYEAYKDLVQATVSRKCVKVIVCLDTNDTEKEVWEQHTNFKGTKYFALVGGLGGHGWRK
jgi:hypothetical protein